MRSAGRIGSPSCCVSAAEAHCHTLPGLGASMRGVGLLACPLCTIGAICLRFCSTRGGFAGNNRTRAHGAKSWQVGDPALWRLNVTSSGIRHAWVRTVCGSDKMPSLFRVLQDVISCRCPLIQRQGAGPGWTRIQPPRGMHACMGRYRQYLRSAGCSRQQERPAAAGVLHIQAPGCSTKLHAKRLPSTATGHRDPHDGCRGGL